MFLVAFSMEAIQEWVKQSKGIVPNVACSFCLVVLEKILELEVRCPCNYIYKMFFTIAFFFIPALLSFLLMLQVQVSRVNIVKWKAYLSSLIPSLVWWIVLFFDGRYVACAMTKLNETGVIRNEDFSVKMCEEAGKDQHQDFLFWEICSQVRNQTSLLH